MESIVRLGKIQFWEGAGFKYAYIKVLLRITWQKKSTCFPSHKHQQIYNVYRKCGQTCCWTSNFITMHAVIEANKAVALVKKWHLLCLASWGLSQSCTNACELHKNKGGKKDSIYGTHFHYNYRYSQLEKAFWREIKHCSLLLYYYYYC